MFEPPPATAPIMRRRRFTVEDRILVSIGLYGTLSLAIGLPLVLMFLWSIADGWPAPRLFPSSFTTARWASVLADDGLAVALFNSFFIAVVVTAATALLALPTAWAMARFPFRLKRLVEIFVLAPMIVPGLVVAIGIGKVFLKIGLSYSILGVILVQIVGTLPLMIRLLTATLEGIPTELINAARSLGAGTTSIILHIILPLAVPGLLAGSLLSFIGSFEEFEKSFIVGAPVVQTLPIRLYMYLDPYAMQIPLASIVAFILLMPALAVFVLAGRVVRDDIMAAGMGKI
ncbi:MAG: ABC transporter permease [Mesorhizobium sp.]|uniref:ABC transporter permease n=1 Tax=Mesorhizobium sp. TaxID=1871066 RepID=UPI001220270F|nr:MAG: ABC transporter permease [Mesorhizobium sp.]